MAAGNPLLDTCLGRSNRVEDDRLTTFMDYDLTYFVFRHFNALNLRDLLQLQANVLSLEQKSNGLRLSRVMCTRQDTATIDARHR